MPLSNTNLKSEDVHDDGRFALRGPQLDGGIVAHSVLLMTAL